jgi:hypothetical protein
LKLFGLHLNAPGLRITKALIKICECSDKLNAESKNLTIRISFCFNTIISEESKEE